jgi:hypothetical protein
MNDTLQQKTLFPLFHSGRSICMVQHSYGGDRKAFELKHLGTLGKLKTFMIGTTSSGIAYQM